MKQNVLLLAVLLALWDIGSAQTYSITSNGAGGGDWHSVSTWTPIRLPICGDTILIKGGDLVAINGQVNFNQCELVMDMTLSGTLDFASNGPKLRIPCNSTFTITVGGLVMASVSNTSGNSNFIDICGEVVWSGSDGPISGPIIWGDPLPVELLSFRAEIEGNQCVLDWSTASEVNNDFFSIERSTNAIDWEEVGDVQGNGNTSTTQVYQYKDPWVLNGVSYYRLSQTDFNGAQEVFPPISVTYNQESDLALYPNPADTYVTLSMKGINRYSIQFIDSNGRSQRLTPTQSTEDAVRVSTSDLPDGAFILSLTGPNGTFKETLFVLH